MTLVKDRRLAEKSILSFWDSQLSLVSLNGQTEMPARVVGLHC